MQQITSIRNLPGIIKLLKSQQKSIVLTGGCFDILHPGHVVFLEKAKKWGDILIVLLENDEKVKALKGANRPVHTQKDRAGVLAALRMVDYIVMLPNFTSDIEYDELTATIKPDVIAATPKDNLAYFKRSAKSSGAKFKLVTSVVGDYSTTKLLTHS